jgi:hypothetical protein
MSEPTKEDFERTIRTQARRIEMLEYEANILRAQKDALHRILVEALQGRRPPGGPPKGWPPDPDPDRLQALREMGWKDRDENLQP